jgi:hypothetical protein
MLVFSTFGEVKLYPLPLKAAMPPLAGSTALIYYGPLENMYLLKKGKSFETKVFCHVHLTCGSTHYFVSSKKKEVLVETSIFATLALVISMLQL